jgi:hypothetical protein
VRRVEARSTHAFKAVIAAAAAAVLVVFAATLLATGDFD